MISSRRIVALVLLMLAATAGRAQEAETGQLLIASPALSDPNFGQTVLLLVHHGTDGSLAVALNRPTWVEPEQAFPEVPSLGDYGDTLFFGGPIAPNQLLIVFESDEPQILNARSVRDRIFVTVDTAILEDIDLTAEAPPRIRLFAGHAAWNPGQLDAEIAAGNWRVLPGTAAQIFDAHPSDLWQRIPFRSDGVTAALR